MTQLREVFGVGRDTPANYVERTDVDNALIANLSRDKHVVIYGSSKQGKTTLRKHCLQEDDSIVVSCLNTMTLEKLNGAILKKAGFRIEQTQVKTVGGSWKYGLEFKGEGKIPLLASASGAGTVERETNDQTETSSTRLEIDLTDVNDVIAALRSIKFTKFIVLEDFHYLPVEVQKEFSFALKAFHENSSICFVIVGVWREKNRLIYYNGDLTNRVASIDVDIWPDASLLKVLTNGETILNVEFDDTTKRSLIEHSANSVSLLQEACYRICEQEGISATQSTKRVVGKDCDIPLLMKTIVDDQGGRYAAFISNFAEGFQQTEYDMYRWLIFVVLSVPLTELETGIRRNVFSTKIKSRHSAGNQLNEGNITQALQSAASLQVTKNIRPIIIDYDQTTRVLNVVDRSFLVWLKYQDRKQLLSEMGIEEEVS